MKADDPNLKNPQETTVSEPLGNEESFCSDFDVMRREAMATELQNHARRTRNFQDNPTIVVTKNGQMAMNM